MPFVFGTRISRFAEREHVAQLNVAEFRGPLHQGVDKRLRSTAALFEPDAVPGLYNLDRLFGGHDLWSELIPPDHANAPTCKWLSTAASLDDQSFEQLIRG
jgi:hypothetical protein